MAKKIMIGLLGIVISACSPKSSTTPASSPAMDPVQKTAGTQETDQKPDWQAIAVNERYTVYVSRSQRKAYVEAPLRKIKFEEYFSPFQTESIVGDRANQACYILHNQGGPNAISQFDGIIGTTAQFKINASQKFDDKEGAQIISDKLKEEGYGDATYSLLYFPIKGVTLTRKNLRLQSALKLGVTNSEVDSLYVSFHQELNANLGDLKHKYKIPFSTICDFKNGNSLLSVYEDGLGIIDLKDNMVPLLIGFDSEMNRIF